MTILHLGVLEQPYDNRPAEKPARRGKKSNRRSAQSSTMTTGDVATILEEHYGIMEMFFDLHEQEIADDLANGLAGSLETIMMGGQAPTDPLAGGTSRIEASFRRFLTEGSPTEAEKSGIPGTPTKAALRGVNHRFKHPYAKDNPRRPSFVNTGLFETSFRVWVD